MPKRSLPSPASNLPVPAELIERRIYLIRGQKVMLDADLAGLYQLQTFNLNKAVKRKLNRFPEDFMFQLNAQEVDSLRFQIGMSKPTGRGGRRYLPYAFTELGVAMLSSVLNTARAVQMNILIMRAFVRLREILATHTELAAKIEKLEAGQRDHAIAISLVAKDVESLAKGVKREFKKLTNPRRQKPRIGFHVPDEK